MTMKQIFGRRYRKLFALFVFLFLFGLKKFILLKENSSFSNILLYSKNNSYFQSQKFQTRKFRVELKDVNISYFYYGHRISSCGKSSMLIATLSRPSAYSLRMGVRNSWRKDVPLTYTHKFFVGSVKNTTLRYALKKESQKYGDIIFTSLIDTYTNLTLKMTALYQWQQYYCPQIRYFLRADEDTVLHVLRLQYWVNKEFNTISTNLNDIVIFGHLRENFRTLRDPAKKWYVPYEAYNNSRYPTFTNGPSYLLTPKVIKMLLKEVKNHKYVIVDDVLYTGIVAEKLGITRYNANNHFANGNPLNKWDNKCDENGVPFLFSVFDENGEIETMSDGYKNALNKLKELQCNRSSAKSFYLALSYIILIKFCL